MQRGCEAVLGKIAEIHGVAEELGKVGRVIQVESGRGIVSETGSGTGSGTGSEEKRGDEGVINSSVGGGGCEGSDGSVDGDDTRPPSELKGEMD